MSDSEYGRQVDLLVSMMRSPSRRRFLQQAGIAGLSLMAADVIAACGGGTSPSTGSSTASNQPVHLTEFTWVGSGQDVQPPKFRADYTKAHPGVSIDFLPGTNSETYPKIVQSLQVTPDKPLVNF